MSAQVPWQLLLTFLWGQLLEVRVQPCGMLTEAAALRKPMLGALLDC